MPWNYQNFDTKMENMSGETAKPLSGKRKPPGRPRLTFILLFAVIGLISIALWGGPSLGMQLTKVVISGMFTKVNQIDSQEAHELFIQKTNKKDSCVFLDVRTEEEFSLSHIPEAYHVENLSEVDKELMEKIKGSQKIIVYCAAGYRSSKACEQLEKMGIGYSSNLNGGIFDWANQGYPISDKKVHPFTSMGQWLLKKKFHK